MKVKVIKTFKGSPNGYDVVEYQEGESHELPDDLAKVAITEKWVEKPKGKKSEAAEHKAAIDTLQVEIAALEKTLEGAAEADSPTIAEQIATKQKMLEYLESE